MIIKISSNSKNDSGSIKLKHQTHVFLLTEQVLFLVLQYFYTVVLCILLLLSGTCGAVMWRLLFWHILLVSRTCLCFCWTVCVSSVCLSSVSLKHSPQQNEVRLLLGFIPVVPESEACLCSTCLLLAPRHLCVWGCWAQKQKQIQTPESLLTDSVLVCRVTDVLLMFLYSL